MRRPSILTVLSIAASLLPLPAMAFGALAVGVPADVAHDGFAYGVTVDNTTEDIAREKALSACRGTLPNQVTSASSQAEALCTLVTTFYHQCVALVMDPAAGTPGIGWAIAPTLDVATEQAMNNCRVTAGEGRQQFCARDTYKCDTN